MHRLLPSLFRSLETKTKQTADGQGYIAVRHRSKRGGGKRGRANGGRRRPAPDDNGGGQQGGAAGGATSQVFIFTLEKTRIETLAALQLISRALASPPLSLALPLCCAQT